MPKDRFRKWLKFSSFYRIIENMIGRTGGSELVDFNSAQAEQVRHLQRMWDDYGRALLIAEKSDGGMAWKNVKGTEYLVHYQWDQDGKKRFKSYGKRNTDSEAVYEFFSETTGKARQTIKDLREDVALTCRLHKAHGMARLPGRQASILERFWYGGLSLRLSLFGGTALLAYEADAGALAPANLVKEDHLQFVARMPDLDAIGLDKIVEACDVDRTGCVVKRGRGRYLISTTDDEPRAEILILQGPLLRLDDDLNLEPYLGLTVSRDCRPIPLTAADPATYVELCKAYSDEPLWDERADAAAALGARIDPSTYGPGAPVMGGP